MDDAVEGKSIPNISRKEAKRQRQAENQAARAAEIQRLNGENRRRLIGTGVLALLGAAESVFGLSKILPSGEKKPVRPMGLPPATPTAEALSQEALYYQAALRGLNSEAVRNPQGFKEIAPRVEQLAIEYFCKEMGYDKTRYQDKIKYEWDEDFKTKVKEASGCIYTNLAEDGAAIVVYGTQDVYVNLTKVMNRNGPKDWVSPALAIDLFAILIHELHHVSSPILDINDPKTPGTKLKGVELMIPSTETSKPGMICLSGLRTALEEAIVQDSTERMVNKLGLKTAYLVSDQYQTWVTRYRTGVLDRFFNSDNRVLLNFHQQSNDRQFFNLIGSNLGYKDDATKEGEEYLARLLLQGIY